jgi:hypothetical protein
MAGFQQQQKKLHYLYAKSPEKKNKNNTIAQ